MTDKDLKWVPPIEEFIEYNIIEPKKYAWYCTLCDGFLLKIEDGRQPNKFHRFMQYLFFGFKWAKIK